MLKKGTLILFLMAAMVLLPLTRAQAQGTYRIEKDETGYYFQTDRHGGWLFNPNELGRPFKVGFVGTYTLETEDGDTYLVTDRYGRFLIDTAALNRLEKSRAESNRALESARGREEVSVVIVGNQVFVPAFLGYGGRETEALLLLDTGASVTVLHDEVAERIPFAKSVEAEITVVGGSKVRAKQVKLDYIRVGSIRKEGIQAAVIEHSGPAMQHQGLLGMDFLRDLQFRIDFEKQVLKVEG